LVTFYETVRVRPARQLAAVRAFLGLAGGPEEVLIRSKVKDKTTPMLSPWLRRVLGPVKPLVAPIRHTSLFRSLHASLAAEIRYPPLTDETRRRLVAYYAADVEALGRRIGRDLSGWLEGNF